MVARALTGLACHATFDEAFQPLHVSGSRSVSSTESFRDSHDPWSRTGALRVINMASDLEIHDVASSSTLSCGYDHHFRTLVESLPQIVWLASADWCVGYQNRRWCEYTCQATPKLTPQATLKLTPSWTLVKEGIWTTSTPIWLTCWTRRRRNRMSWIGSASFPAKVSGANGLLDSWGSPATPSAVISLEPRSAFKNVLRRGASMAPRSESTSSSVPLPRETPSSFSRNWPPEGSISTCGPCNGPWRPCVRRNGPGRWPLSGSRPHRANRSRSTSVKRSSRSPVSPSRFI